MTVTAALSRRNEASVSWNSTISAAILSDSLATVAELRSARDRLCPAGLGRAEQQGPLHFLDGLGDLDAPGAGVGAVEGGPAAPDALLVVQHGQALGGALVARVEDEAVGVDDRRGPKYSLSAQNTGQEVV